MAVRKAMITSTPSRPELDALLESARKRGVSEEALQEQRASFVYGNAPVHMDGITKDSAREASHHNRLMTA